MKDFRRLVTGAFTLNHSDLVMHYMADIIQTSWSLPPCYSHLDAQSPIHMTVSATEPTGESLFHSHLISMNVFHLPQSLGLRQGKTQLFTYWKGREVHKNSVFHIFSSRKSLWNTLLFYSCICRRWIFSVK